MTQLVSWSPRVCTASCLLEERVVWEIALCIWQFFSDGAFFLLFQNNYCYCSVLVGNEKLLNFTLFFLIGLVGGQLPRHMDGMLLYWENAKLKPCLSPCSDCPGNICLPVLSAEVCPRTPMKPLG